MNEERDLEPEAPEPGPAPADDVVLAQGRALDAEEARPRDQPTEEEVGEAAEDDDDRERGEQGTHQSQSFCCVNQTNNAGAVITATTVAARVSLRQLFASSKEASPCARVPGRGASIVAIVSVYAGAQRG